MADTHRLFVGVPVAVPVAQALAATCETLARRARHHDVRIAWIAPASYHVTLAYFGPARPDAVSAVIDRLRAIAAGARPLRWKTARLGAFASPARATVVWAGVDEPTGELARLAGAVAAMGEELGFPRDRRPYHPHVTIGRLRTPAAVAEVLLPLSEQTFSETRCDSLTLYETVTKSTGSEYRVVARAPLGAPQRQSAPLQTGSFDASLGSDDGWDRTS